jgi:hypothetical protein
MRVTITLKKVSVGTELRIVQEGVPAPIPPEACYLGWQESLVLLAKLVEAKYRISAAGGAVPATGENGPGAFIPGEATGSHTTGNGTAIAAGSASGMGPKKVYGGVEFRKSRTTSF